MTSKYLIYLGRFSKIKTELGNVFKSFETDEELLKKTPFRLWLETLDFILCVSLLLLLGLDNDDEDECSE